MHAPVRSQLLAIEGHHTHSRIRHSHTYRCDDNYRFSQVVIRKMCVRDLIRTGRNSDTDETANSRTRSTAPRWTSHALTGVPDSRHGSRPHRTRGSRGRPGGQQRPATPPPGQPDARPHAPPRGLSAIEMLSVQDGRALHRTCMFMHVIMPSRTPVDGTTVYIVLHKANPATCRPHSPAPCTRNDPFLAQLFSTRPTADGTIAGNL